MRLKFYLIGLGIGIIVTAVVMGIALRGRTREMTDDEIRARARELGMVEASTLTERESANNGQGTQLSASDTQSGTAAEQQAQGQAGALAAGEAASGESVARAGDSSDGSNGQSGQSDEAGSGNTAVLGEDSPLVVTGEPDDGEAPEAEDAGAETQRADAAAGGDTGEGAAGTDTETAGEDSSSAQADTPDAQGGTGGTGNTQAAADSGTGASETRGEQPVTGSIVVTIPDGVGSEEICELLQTAGVIDSASAFNNFLVQSDRDRFIGTGARLIPRGATYEEVGFIISGR
ncbi:MAG: hypothetical protein IJQ21_07300 [Lachnospiraceae bacterium]|nr:hypothetical protein [Lachnospiraceae bacterium]